MILISGFGKDAPANRRAGPEAPAARAESCEMPRRERCGGGGPEGIMDLEGSGLPPVIGTVS
jgi:hypothetical protein